MVVNRIINGEGTVFIDDEVTNFIGQDTARLILDFKSQGIEPVVNINSIGGSVFAGYQIIDAMLQVTANTHISGLAASIAGIIALHGSTRTANDFSLMMLHKATSKNKEIEDLVNNRLRAILEKTRLPKETITDIFEGGKDVFFDASEMLTFGLIDAIKSTERKKKMDHNALNCKEMWQVFNKFNNESEMKDVKNTLNLKDTATESDVINKIKEIEQSKDQAMEAVNAATAEKVAAENEVTGLKESVTNLENSLKEAKEHSAKILVSNAISSGKVKETERKEWEGLAVDNFANAEKLIGSITVAHSSHVAPVTNVLDTADLTQDTTKLVEFMRNATKASNLFKTDQEKFNKYNEAYLNAINL